MALSLHHSHFQSHLLPHHLHHERYHHMRARQGRHPVWLVALSVGEMIRVYTKWKLRNVSMAAQLPMRCGLILFKNFKRTLINTNRRSTFQTNNLMWCPSLLPSLSIIRAELIIIHHLGVIVDIDHINRPVSVTDEEDGVVIWLQHLKKVYICSAVDENKVLELQHNIHQNNTFNFEWQA